MKQLTAKERKEIYIDAAEMIDECNENLCCSAIAKKAGFHHEWFYGFPIDGEINYPSDLTVLVKGLFPEFALFEPEEKMSQFSWYGADNKLRITILCMCASICDNP